MNEQHESKLEIQKKSDDRTQKIIRRVFIRNENIVLEIETPLGGMPDQR